MAVEEAEKAFVIGIQDSAWHLPSKEGAKKFRNPPRGFAGFGHGGMNKEHFGSVSHRLQTFFFNRHHGGRSGRRLPVTAQGKGIITFFESAFNFNRAGQIKFNGFARRQDPL